MHPPPHFSNPPPTPQEEGSPGSQALALVETGELLSSHQRDAVSFLRQANASTELDHCRSTVGKLRKQTRSPAAPTPPNDGPCNKGRRGGVERDMELGTVELTGTRRSLSSLSPSLAFLTCFQGSQCPAPLPGKDTKFSATGTIKVIIT